MSGTLAPKDRSGWVAQYCPLEMAPVHTGHALRLALLAAATPACLHPKSLQSCSTLCDPMDCSPSGSSVHGIFQARILKCIATPFSRKGDPSPGSPDPGIEPGPPALQADSLPPEPPEKQCRRPRFDPWSGRSPGGEQGNPLQYSCLGNPVDRGA